MKKIFLCAISNISSGNCPEDCRFCAQSARYRAIIERYRQKPLALIVEEAKAARKTGAVGFCLVTSGKGLDDAKLTFVCEAARAVKKAEPNLGIIACNGTATVEALRELKKAGVGSYNHNLETSESFYPKICTTHTWQERYQTCQNVKEAGLMLCTGGIFGLGETLKDRIDMLKSLKELGADSVPLNFFHPNPALPLSQKTMDASEALEMITLARQILGERRIMVAGGREITFGKREVEIFAAGADAIVIGNYLTTKGRQAKEDLAMIKKAGCEIARSCHE